MRINSLKGQRAFERVSREGRRWSREFLQLREIENSLRINRIGIVIPEKAIHGAVDRNRVKRLLSEAYRSIDESIKKGYDLVFMVRESPKLNRMNFARDIMMKLFLNAGLLESSDSV